MVRLDVKEGLGMCPVAKVVAGDSISPSCLKKRKDVKSMCSSDFFSPMKKELLSVFPLEREL